MQLSPVTIDNLATYLFPVLCAFTIVVAYLFWMRPMLKQTPGLKTLYATEETWINALSVKFGGAKQKLTVVGLSVIGGLLELHDTIAPLVTQAGVDPTVILPKVPAWVWPVGTMAVLWLVQYFRNLADKAARANAEALLNAGHSLAAAAPGLPVTSLPSPNPLLANLPDKPGV